MMFFFVFFFQLIIMVVQTLGLLSELKAGSGRLVSIKDYSQLDGGTVGIFTTVSMFDGSWTGTLLGLFCLVVTICFGLAAAGTALLLTKVRELTAALINPQANRIILILDSCNLPQQRR